MAETADNLDEVMEASDSGTEAMPEEEKLDTKEINDLLFLVQSLGCPKTVGTVETYVKNEDCIDFLKELYKILRNENTDSTLKRLELGEWNVVESDLLKLLVSYPEDRQLAFYTILLLVSLTEKPQKGHYNVARYTAILQNYKQSFISSKYAIKNIVNLLAECLSKPEDERTEQHDQLLEMIVYLFRNLLAIPDSQPALMKNQKGVVVYNSREDNLKDLQHRFLHKLADETVLEAFVYMAQDMTVAAMKNLNLAFLEIMSSIFSLFSPKSLFEASSDDQLSKLLAHEKALNQEKLAGVSSRHSKFGSVFLKRRSLDSTGVLFSNPFNPVVDFNRAPGQQLKVKPKARDNTRTLARAKEVVDYNMMEKVKHFASEVLEHCFSPLIESVFVEFYKDSQRLEPEDKTSYFMFQAFMYEFLRRKHEHSGTAADIDVAPLAESLKLQNFEYLYRSILIEIRKTSKKEMNTAELQGSLRMLTQLLYLVRDMAVSANENTRKNAQIILQNIFYHDISRICRRAFDYWVPGVTSREFLEELVELCHLNFSMLEDYSRGKKLRVRTERVLKQKQRGDESDDYLEGAEAPTETSVYQERQMNFLIEFSHLVDPEVIAKLVFLLGRFKENRSEINEYIATFFERVLKDCKADWIFFQMEFLVTFREILNDSFASRQPKHARLYAVIKDITHNFFELFRKNALLPVESLFRVKEKQIKDLVINNYRLAPTEEYRPKKKKRWTKDDDLLLIDHYESYKDMPSVYEILTGLLKGKSLEQVKRRVKKLKLKDGEDAARKAFKLLHLTEDVYDKQTGQPKCFATAGKPAVMDFLHRLHADLTEFWEETGGGSFQVLPKTESDSVLLANSDVSSFLLSLGFKESETFFTFENAPAKLQELLHQFQTEECYAFEEGEEPLS